MLAFVMILALAACGQTAEKPAAGDSKTEAEEPFVLDPENFTVADLARAEYGTAYVSLYEKFGKETTIDDVTEDPDTGLAYATFEGEEYELGMDFLSMAMVYNAEVPEAASSRAPRHCAEWWKLYIQRWNYLVPRFPSIPTSITTSTTPRLRVFRKTHKPFWGPARALFDWSSEKANKRHHSRQYNRARRQFRYPALEQTTRSIR